MSLQFNRFDQYLIPVRNSGNWIETELLGIARNSWEFLPIPELHGIPEIQSNSGIPDRNYTSPSSILMSLQFNRFDQYLIPVRNSGNWIETELLGIVRNCWEFLPIPEFWQFSPIPELHGIDGTQLMACRPFMLCDDGVPGTARNWFRGRNWFRNVQHCGIG
jgi:hypothetical protein